jgi:sortase A
MFTARSSPMQVVVHLDVRERIGSWTGPEGHDLMALTSAPPAGSQDRAADDDTNAGAPPPPPAPPTPDQPGGRAAAPRPITPRAIAIAVGAWLAVTAICVPLVLYGVGPMLEQRDQTALMSDYRVDIRQAAAQTNGLPGVELPTRALETGSPVAIVDIPAMKMEQVVVEGVGPQQTRRGPGHVPGTAGPGQPGNSAVVARRSAFGGPFRPLGSLELGDRILVTTTQGQSIYVVTEVRSDEIADGAGTRPQPAEAETATTTTTAPPAPEAPPLSIRAAEAPPAPPILDAALPEGALTTDHVYGPTEDDRLTLVTSAATRPWNTERATIVVAEMRGRPFQPTPQSGRTADQDGRGADANAWAPLILAALAYLVAVGAAVVLYRRARPRSAYLLTAPPLVAATILTAEAVARLLPAWT